MQMMFYSDDPIRDAERYQAWLDRQEKEEDEDEE
jgi:hypothetical protein